jgi:hypothetical protein
MRRQKRVNWTVASFPRIASACIFFLAEILIYLRRIQINISVTKKMKADYFGESLLSFGSESSV